jgi:tetratricopeptide (TPR) repeat protein
MSNSEASLRELLDASRLLAMNCEYKAALDSIEDILRQYPGDLDALGLKGNVLEQKALDEHEASPRPLAITGDYIAALACYEQVLKVDPRNTVALIDLGDHYKYIDAFDQAYSFYWSAIELLEAGEERVGAESEIRELLSTCDDLVRYPTSRARAQQLADRCNQLLMILRSTNDEGPQ